MPIGRRPFEILPHERFVDDGRAGSRVVRAEIRGLPRKESSWRRPTGRDAQKVRQHRAGRRAVYRNEAIPSRAARGAATRPQPRSRRQARPQMLGHLVPIRRPAEPAARPFPELRTRSAEKPSGTMRQMVEGGGKQAGHEKAPGNRRPLCTAISACIKRRRACGSRSAFERARRVHRRSAQRRRQAEQQRHGQRQRQAECQHAPVGRKRQPRRIVRRIDPAHDERRRPPREHAAQRRRQKCQHALSTSTSCTRRLRPAPIETRSAISRARAAACAVIRFATLAHAISSTSATSTPRASSAGR